MPAQRKPADAGGALRARRRESVYPAGMDGSTAIGPDLGVFGGFDPSWWPEDGREYESADEWPEWCDEIAMDGSTAIGPDLGVFGGCDPSWWPEDGREYESADEWPEWCDEVAVGAVVVATGREGGRR